MNTYNAQQIVNATPCAYEETRAMIYSIRERYPFAVYSVCGRSWAGRALFCLELGKSDRPVLYAGGFNGQEWMTTLILLRFFERMCGAMSADAELSSVNIKETLKEHSIMIVPCVNPDGVQIAQHGAIGAGCYSGFAERISQGDYSNWNANARGVDITHNFDFSWDVMRELERESGIHSPSPKWFGGQTPESEPETQALTRLCRSKSIKHAVAMYSPGERIAWDFGAKTPVRAEMMAKILASSSNYALTPLNPQEESGGFKNWFINEFKRPAFNIEIGKGKNPLPIEDFESIYYQVEEMLLFAAML